MDGKLPLLGHDGVEVMWMSWSPSKTVSVVAFKNPQESSSGDLLESSPRNHLKMVG
jgi:hypothetical protein